MNATTKLRIATYLRRLADRLAPPAKTYAAEFSGSIDGKPIQWVTSSSTSVTA